MNHSGQINEIAGALAKAQARIKNATKESENPFFHSRYADLASVWDACREPLAENGIAVIQSPEYIPDTNMVVLETMLTHSSGQWMASQLHGIPVKEVNDSVDGVKVRKEVESRTPQAIGSCITYLRRYALAAFVGVAPEDDDGNVASGKEGEAPPETTSGDAVDLKSLKCPKCGKVGAIIKGKPEYGGGFVCWKREGGCGKNFAVNDADLFPQKPAAEAPKAQEAPKAEPATQEPAKSQRRTKAAASAPATPSAAPSETKQPEPETKAAEPETKPAASETKPVDQEVSRNRMEVIAEIVKITSITQPQLALKLDRLCGGDPTDAKEASAHLKNIPPQNIDAALEAIVLFARKHGAVARDVILEESQDAVLVEELKKGYEARVS